MEDPTKVLNRAVAAHLAPALRQAGFKKHGLTWNREERGLIAVINLQRSSGNTGHKVKFAINASVGFATDRKQGPLKEYQAHQPLRSRVALDGIGEGFSDQWWEIEPVDDAQATAQMKHCATLIETHALPWLDARRTPDAALLSLAEDRRKLPRVLEKYNLSPKEVGDLISFKNRHYDRLIDLLEHLKAEQDAAPLH